MVVEGILEVGKMGRSSEKLEEGFEGLFRIEGQIRILGQIGLSGEIGLVNQIGLLG